MTNGIALILGLVIVTLISLDISLNAAEASLFLARQIADLIEWMAFWR